MRPSNLDQLMRLSGTAIRATEAVAFALERDFTGHAELRLIHHIRDDDSSPESRTQAVDAFRRIVAPCIEVGRDGVIQIEGTRHAGTGQYCVIKLAADDKVIVGVTAFITRCIDDDDAQRQLAVVRACALDGTIPLPRTWAGRLLNRLTNVLQRLIRRIEK
jgi:hypothetical protein